MFIINIEIAEIVNTKSNFNWAYSKNFTIHMNIFDSDLSCNDLSRSIIFKSWKDVIRLKIFWNQNVSKKEDKVMYDINQTHATDAKSGRPLAIQKRDNEPLRIECKERYLRSYLWTESVKIKFNR